MLGEVIVIDPFHAFVMHHKMNFFFIFSKVLTLKIKISDMKRYKLKHNKISIFYFPSKLFIVSNIILN